MAGRRALATAALALALAAVLVAGAGADDAADAEAEAERERESVVDEFVRRYVGTLRADPLAGDDAGAAQQTLAESVRLRDARTAASSETAAGIDSREGATVHHMWSTPIFVANIAEFGVNVTEFNAAICSHVMRHYLRFIEGAGGNATENLKRIIDANSDEAVTEGFNNAFWNWQVMQDGWERVIGTLPEVQRLMDIMNEATDTYLGELGVPHETVLRRSHDVSQDAWATVHSHNVFHAAHLHEDSLVSGVYYLKLPPNSGPIAFYDARGPHPPFDNDLSVNPRHGDIVLFPSWLVHQVMPTTGTSTRMSIAVNFAGRWKTTTSAQVSVSAGQALRRNAARFNAEGPRWRHDAAGRGRQVEAADSARPRGTRMTEEEAAKRKVRAGGIDTYTRDFDVEGEGARGPADDGDEDEDEDADGDEGEDDEADFYFRKAAAGTQKAKAKLPPPRGKKAGAGGRQQDKAPRKAVPKRGPGAEVVDDDLDDDGDFDDDDDYDYDNMSDEELEELLKEEGHYDSSGAREGADGGAATAYGWAAYLDDDDDEGDEGLGSGGGAGGGKARARADDVDRSLYAFDPELDPDPDDRREDPRLAQTREPQAAKKGKRAKKAQRAADQSIMTGAGSMATEAEVDAMIGIVRERRAAEARAKTA